MNQAYWTYSLNILKKYLEYTQICSNIFDISLLGKHGGLMGEAGWWAVRADGRAYIQS
jgi:hypothetical protein